MTGCELLSTCCLAPCAVLASSLAARVLPKTMFFLPALAVPSQYVFSHSGFFRTQQAVYWQAPRSYLGLWESSNASSGANGDKQSSSSASATAGSTATEGGSNDMPPQFRLLLDNFLHGDDDYRKSECRPEYLLLELLVGRERIVRVAVIVCSFDCRLLAIWFARVRFWCPHALFYLLLEFLASCYRFSFLHVCFRSVQVHSARSRSSLDRAKGSFSP